MHVYVRAFVLDVQRKSIVYQTLRALANKKFSTNENLCSYSMGHPKKFAAIAIETNVVSCAKLCPVLFNNLLAKDYFTNV